MLSLGAVRAPDDPEERTRLLAELLLGAQNQQSGTIAEGAAVVYVTLQRTAQEVADALVGAGIDARPYHAGLPPLQREVCFWLATRVNFGEERGEDSPWSHFFRKCSETRGGDSGR